MECDGKKNAVHSTGMPSLCLVCYLMRYGPETSMQSEVLTVFRCMPAGVNDSLSSKAQMEMTHLELTPQGTICSSSTHASILVY